jgi:hypothetical protein
MTQELYEQIKRQVTLAIKEGQAYIDKTAPEEFFDDKTARHYRNKMKNAVMVLGQVLVNLEDKPKPKREW